MTREEQIREAALKYNYDLCTPFPGTTISAFIDGAVWADEHPDLYSVTRKAVEREREYLIDKACEQMKLYVLNNDSVDIFEMEKVIKKAMGEQQ